ncbi:hypothetical protein [Kitasatospora sp. NPDC090091]|uniref:hypothetical protein n=1 Tax=Kitasatospora sp. NPDC090091 TaxID=3364081 RepID=UPI003827D81D
MNLEAELAGDHLRLPGTAFLPADSAPGDGTGATTGTATGRVVPAAAVRDADPAASPPEIRTVAGETVFVRAERRAELESFCLANRIPRQSRPDVWGALLEPFLDTEFTPERQAATQACLSRVAGLSAGEVADIRARVAPLMRAYNGLHWDWHHLGLADLLDAATADWIPEHLRIAPGEQAAFYSWAAGIADLGRNPGATDADEGSSARTEPGTEPGVG